MELIKKTNEKWKISPYMPKPREDVQRGALFHSTPEGPIHRGTITQAILVRNPILPFGHENLRGFFSGFYLGTGGQN